MTDLLAVIWQWGAPPESIADIAPVCIGDGVVDVSDLLLVVADWGACACGNGEPLEMPESYEDCVDMCTGLTGDAWADCMRGCFRVLCNNGQPQFCEP